MSRNVRDALDFENSKWRDTLPLRERLGRDAERSSEGFRLTANRKDRFFECCVFLGHEKSKAMLESESQAMLSLHAKALLYVVEMTFKDRLKRARKERSPKTTQRDLATQLGVTVQAVSGWERGEAMPEPDKLTTIAQYLGVDLNWLMGGATIEVPAAHIRVSAGAPVIRPEGPELTEAVSDVRTPKLSQFGDYDVEIRGITAGGEDDDFLFDGDAHEMVRRPPGLLHKNGVFALRIVNDSMSNKYEAGDIIFVQERTPIPGDHVVIELHHPDDPEQSGKSFVKKLVRRTGRRIYCTQYNPPKDVEFDAGEVKAIYRVFPNPELFG